MRLSDSYRQRTPPLDRSPLRPISSRNSTNRRILPNHQSRNRARSRGSVLRRTDTASSHPSPSRLPLGFLHRRLLHAAILVLLAAIARTRIIAAHLLTAITN